MDGTVGRKCVLAGPSRGPDTRLEVCGSYRLRCVKSCGAIIACLRAEESKPITRIADMLVARAESARTKVGKVRRGRVASGGGEVKGTLGRQEKKTDGLKVAIKAVENSRENGT